MARMKGIGRSGAWLAPLVGVSLCLSVSPLWTATAEIILQETGVCYHTLLTGEGRNDDTSRLYLLTEHTADDSSYYTVRELTFSQGGWLIAPVCSLRTIGDMTLADGRNDGMNRLYLIAPDSTLLEYTFSDGEWLENTVLARYSSALLHGLLAAPLRRDDTTRLYCHPFQKLLEISYSNGNWMAEEIDAGLFSYFTGAGSGRNDDTMRLYTDWSEITYYDEGWRAEYLGIGIKCIGDGRGDSIIRLYNAEFRIPDDVGQVIEYTYTKTGWEKELVDEYPGEWAWVGGWWDARIGIARRDGRSRLYFRGLERGDGIGGLYEYTFSEGEWHWVFVPFPDSSTPGRLNFEDLEKLKIEVVKKNDRLAMGKLRNDDTSRVYCITWSDSCLVEINMEATGIEENTATENSLTSLSLFPNPCYEKIRIDVFTFYPAELRIYNVLGQFVKGFSMPRKGDHTLHWDGCDEYGRPVGSGIYLFILRTSNRAIVKKVILLKRKEAMGIMELWELLGIMGIMGGIMGTLPIFSVIVLWEVACFLEKVSPGEPESGWVRDFILVSTGYYATEGGGGQQGYGSDPFLKYALYQNYPNPCRGETHIRFQVPRPTRVSLKLYDVSGRLVRTLIDSKTQNLEPGTYNLTWDGRDDRGMKLASGVYFYRLEAEDFSATKKLVLIR